MTEIKLNPGASKRLFSCKCFDTKNDAFKFITGHAMTNNMVVGEETTDANVIFLQLGTASYKNDEGTHYTGKNTLRESGSVIVSECYTPNSVHQNFSKPTLIFLKRTDAKGKCFYVFNGLYETESITSRGDEALNTTTYRRTASTVYV